MGVYRFAGGACDTNPLNVPITQGEYHKLRLDYYGHEDGKWVYFVDDIVRYIEYANTPPTLGRLLQANPRVALFFVGMRDGTYVEGDMEPLRVWSNQNPDAQQTSRVDGFGVTNTTSFAQEVFVDPSVTNITKIKLFLVNGHKYFVSAHIDNQGRPGTLINEIHYEPDQYGFQDVPLFVPRHWDRIWILVRSQSPERADFGTSAPRTNPYPGRLLASNNVGRTWSPADRDMYFITYERR